jgi:prepilin-type N-terminal cleavage/methylation domain-containing protein
MLKRRKQSGFTLLEVMMGSVLLAAATAGVLLPIVSAAAAQTDAQRRVVATRFGADVIEQLAGGQLLTTPVKPVDLGYTGSAYQELSCQVQTEANVGLTGLTLVTATVSYKQTPMITLKTLINSN